MENIKTPAQSRLDYQANVKWHPRLSLSVRVKHMLVDQTLDGTGMIPTHDSIIYGFTVVT